MHVVERVGGALMGIPTPVGHVDADGGPLLLCELSLVPEWHGIEGGDYQRACAFFDADPAAQGGLLALRDGNAIV